MIVVDEREPAAPAAPITPDLAHDPAIGDGDEKLGHFRSSLAAFTMASISTRSMSSPDRGRGATFAERIRSPALARS